ncbi:stage II sporulation protein P [Brevibacillus laterosporus]|uniref:stage II sporulation protein P n=1 Tax=Brevibacillus laterosporus TaxID=1465 RepID=UPI000CE4B808|nr:stage II sporulation protein P [Brevibacillus laterosporus]MED1665487.1 stage II sporulation protein P [Brevibacillus laterosporus]MED1671272.1 stage II sporulation protein P [Brevibacillus laterosporus]MED1721061.1 stage II sporulation protein P [Brevibacillus laterosporus]PPA84240.1 stage II sporulation protein P [Brevibacillus laterosporus]
MFLRIHTILIAVCFLLLLMPQSFAQAATHVEVTVDQLNIRSAPGTTNQIVGTITKASRLPILTEKNGWIQVKLANGKQGWVLNKYVKKLEIPQVKYVKSNVDMLNVRAEPNTTAQILQIIDQNGVFLQMKKQGDWAQIKLSDNVSGWVNARFLTETAAPTPKPIPNPVPVSTPVPSLTSPEPVVPLPPFVTENGQVAGTIVLSESYDVYVEPNVLSTVIGQLPVNTTINHYGYTNDWYKISFNGTDAYIFKPVAQEGAVQGQPSDIPGAPTPNTGQAEAMIRVKNSDTNLRSGPGTNYSVVGNVQPGEVYPIVQNEGDWYVIRLADNSTAYIASWIVDSVQQSTTQPANVPNAEYNTGMIGNETVYIYHTHNRESWRNVARNTSGSSVDDPQINITLVGKRLGELLQAHGIQAMVNQDDFAKKLAEQKKSYSLSYAESYKAVSAAAAMNPSLQYIFDIHRDSDEPRSKVALTLHDKTYSRILFVIGTAHPNYLQNKKLAENLHARLEASYPGLSRGIILKGKNQGNGVYNQSISEGSLLLEFGGTNNTLEECYNTAEAFANVLVTYMFESQIAVK